MKYYNFDSKKIEQLKKASADETCRSSREDQLLNGDTESQVQLAFYYIENNQITLAKEYLKSAADKGHFLAAYYYAYFWLTEQFGRYSSENPIKIGIKYLTIAANGGVENALLLLGFFYEINNGVILNVEKANELYSKVIKKNPIGIPAIILSENNSAEKLKKIAADYESYENPLERNWLIACCCYFKASKLGDLEASYKYALYYAGLKGIVRSNDILFEKLENISEEYADACFDLGILYLYQKKDETTAFKHFEKAYITNTSNHLFSYVVGYCYERGIGTTSDIKKAVSFYLENLYFEKTPNELGALGNKIYDERKNLLRGFLLIAIASNMSDVEAKKALLKIYNLQGEMLVDKITKLDLLEDLSQKDPFYQEQLGFHYYQEFLKIQQLQKKYGPQYKEKEQQELSRKAYSLFMKAMRYGSPNIINKTVYDVTCMLENDAISLDKVDDFVVKKCIDYLTKSHDGTRYLVAEYQLAVRLAYGYFKGQTLDVDKAKSHLNRIHRVYDNDNTTSIPLAERELALFDLFGYGVDADYYSAIEKLDMAIERGDTMSYYLKELFETLPCDFDFGKDTTSINQVEVERAIRYFERLISTINNEFGDFSDFDNQTKRMLRNTIDEIIKKLKNMLRTLRYSEDESRNDLLFLCNFNQNKCDFIKEQLREHFEYEIRDKSVYINDNTAVFVGETTDNKRVIYKFIKKQDFANMECSGEALVMTELAGDSGIIKLVDVGQFDDFEVLVLEYADPIENFREEAEAIQFAINICSTLKHMCNKGFIHRDIKPQNLYRRYENNIPVYLIGDFGIAKKVTDETVKTDGCSTPKYEAPEGQISIKSDLYSLGLCLCELLNSGTRKINCRKQKPDYCSDELFEIILGMIEEDDERRFDVDTTLNKLVILYTSKYGTEYDFLRI